MKKTKFMLLNLPNPPLRNIYREYAGGFGTTGTISSETLLPTYLLYGASALKNLGVEYEILDAQAMGYDFSQVVDTVKKSRPDVLISWPCLPSLYDDLSILCQIKKEKQKMLIVALGTVCNAMPEEILIKNGRGVDLVIKGWHPHYNLIFNLASIFMDNEIDPGMFDRIGGALYLKDDDIVKSPVEPCYEDLNNLSFDIYHQLPLDKYLGEFENIDGSTVECIPVTTSVGCPFSCMYCPYPIGFGKKIVYKSVEKIIEEIEFINKNFGISGFMFRDQLFTHKKERILKLCEQIIKRELKINWLIEARTDQVDLELLKKMKDSGCFRIHYGVETGTEDILKKTGKPGVDLDMIKKTFDETKEAGIFGVAHIILGLPGENEKTLKNTINLLYEMNPDRVNLNVLTPYPGTRLFKMASEKGWISSFDWSKYTSHNSILKTDDLSVEELENARIEIKNKFRNHKIIHDPNYRKFFIKSVPRKVRDRIVLYLKKGK